MPRDLFGDVHHPVTRLGSRSRYTVTLSLVAHAAAILGIAAATILGPVVLPGLASSDMTYVRAILPPAPPPPAIRRPAEEPPPPALNLDAAPTEAPDGVVPEPDVLFDGAPGPDVGLDVVLGESRLETVVGEPPPSPDPSPAATGPLPVGGRIRMPVKTMDVAPVYPAIARAAYVEGIVIIEAIVGIDGRVESARVLRGVPLLDAAALAAVRQWEYTPTLLNGVPVAVVMTVTVSFTLR